MSADLRIGLLGHGRFGAALAGLLSQAGYRWRAWDPHCEIPASHRAVEPDALVDDSELIILAVPVRALEPTLRRFGPRLQNGQQLLDVCSVKQEPCRLMHKILGATVGHAGCHPLFGPLSIARADPLRTIVCPNPHHPQTAEVARALFESLGSEVTMQDPETHDRLMAQTHVMAFFIARGLLDLGLREDLHWVPPSFAALAASIAAVRADSGHLFRTIQSENPYAAEARSSLIDALTQIDSGLGDTLVAQDISHERSIPDLGATASASLQAGDQLGQLDHELLVLLKRRLELAARIDAGTSLKPTTSSVGIEVRRGWASEIGLDAEEVESVFARVLAMQRKNSRP